MVDCSLNSHFCFLLLGFWIYFSSSLSSDVLTLLKNSIKSLLITSALLLYRSRQWGRAKCFAILNNLVVKSQLRFGVNYNYLFFCLLFVVFFLSFVTRFLIQLFLPFLLQSDIAGEVIKILRKDGGKSGHFHQSHNVGFLFCVV